MKKLQIPLFRGYVNDYYSDELIIKNEYVVFSFKKVRSHFVTFSETDLEGFDSQLLFDLDCFNFWLSINDRKTYWDNYLKKEHIISKRYGYPEWVGRSILTESKKNIEQSFIMIKQYLDSICTSKKDMFIRIQSLIPCYEVLVPSKNHLKHIYSCCGVPLNGDKLELDISFEKVETAVGRKECKVYCTITFIDEEDEDSKLFFEVLVFTPDYFANEILIDDWVFPPHIVIERLDIATIKRYLLKTLGLISASSKLELILKLGVFTNSFIEYDSINTRLYSDLEYKFETIVFDQRSID